MKYIDKDNYIENKGDVLTYRYFHKFFHPNGVEAIGDCGSAKIDNKTWDIFHIQYETKDAYYGTPMLGMGLMDCMILKKDTRDFLESEMNCKVGLGSLFNSECRNICNIRINPIKSKFEVQ